MRVALIDPSLFTLPYDAALAAGLQAEGHDVTLYGRAPGPDDNSAGDAPLAPIFYRMVGSRFGAALPKAARLGLKGVDHVRSMQRLRQCLGAYQPDVIHFQWLPLPMVDRHFLSGLRRLAPLVLTVHDTNPFNGNPASALQRVGGGAAFARFDRLIVHTEQGRGRMLEQGYAAERIAIMPHGLLGETPPPSPADPMQGELTFLLFGKIKPYKGVDLLIEAFARLPAALRAQARLRVVGKPYMDMAPLSALAAERGVADRLTLETRFVSDGEVGSLFGQGVIAAFPYREIEASGVLSLAIAHGRPILASRLGGFAENIADGVHGLLTPPEDVGALAAAMARLIEDRGFASACAGHVRALAGSVPGWGEIARRTGALYAGLADGQP